LRLDIRLLRTTAARVDDARWFPSLQRVRLVPLFFFLSEHTAFFPASPHRHGMFHEKLSAPFMARVTTFHSSTA
jgi:hypothetical protein